MRSRKGFGSSIGTSGRSAPPPIPGYWDVVPHMDISAVDPAKVPRPPLLPDVGDEDAVRFLGSTFASCCRVIHGEESRTDNPKAQFSRWKQWPQLVEGVRSLRAVGLAPARWTWFAFKFWNDQMGKWGAPFFAWTYSGTMIRKHAEWARDSTGWMGGQVIMTPALRELASLNAAMEVEIAKRCPADREELAEVVAEFFPGRKFKLLVSAAAHEADAERERLGAEAASGGWIWGR